MKTYIVDDVHGQDVRLRMIFCLLDPPRRLNHLGSVFALREAVLGEQLHLENLLDSDDVPR